MGAYSVSIHRLPLEVEEAGLEIAEELLDVLPADPLLFERLPEPGIDLVQASIKTLLVHAPHPGDVGDFQLRPHPDEQPVLRGEGLDLAEDNPEDAQHQGALLLLVQLLTGPQFPGSHGLERLLRHEAPGELGGELGPDLRELVLGHLHALSLEDVTGLAEEEPIPDHQLLQPFRDRPQAARLGGAPPLGPEVVLVVEQQPVDDDREVRPDVAPPLEQAEYGVILLNELDHHRLLEVLRVLGTELGPPATEGDDLLDELQVPQEELLRGQVVAGWGGEGGHRECRGSYLESSNGGDSIRLGSFQECRVETPTELSRN
jgi:hypothetical protein